MSKVIDSKKLGDSVKQRRFMLVPISTRALSFMLTKGVYEIDSTLPDDVIDLGAVLDPYSDTILIRVASMSFTPVKDGEQIPRMDRKITVKEATGKYINRT